MTFAGRALSMWHCERCQVRWADDRTTCWCCHRDDRIHPALDECVPGGILELVNACDPAQRVRVRM